MREMHDGRVPYYARCQHDQSPPWRNSVSGRKSLLICKWPIGAGTGSAGRRCLFMLLWLPPLGEGSRARGAEPPADAASGIESVQGPTDFFENRGRWNSGVQVAYEVENAIPRNVSHINMLIAQPQVGLIVADPKGPSSPCDASKSWVKGFWVAPFIPADGCSARPCCFASTSSRGGG